MKPLEVHKFESRLDELFNKTGVVTDAQAQSHWARYLCVLVSGYIETSVRETVSQYTRNRASPTVLNYVDSQLAWFQNPKIDKINQLLHAFDPTIAAKIGALDDATRNAVDSVVNNRHQIAHGRDLGIGAVTIKNYYTEVKKFVEFLCTELT
jgi:RiboL-PSP-HEPN